MSNTFYEEIDNVFDILYNKYGFDRELIYAKELIIKKFIYFNDNNGNNIVNILKKKNFTINENGYIMTLS